VADALRQCMQAIVTEFAELLGGASLVGDIVVLMECHTGDGATVMRHFDSGVPSWRQLGLLASASQSLQTEEFIMAMSGGDSCGDEDA
jgi:hypothetical protein